MKHVQATKFRRRERYQHFASPPCRPRAYSLTTLNPHTHRAILMTRSAVRGLAPLLAALALAAALSVAAAPSPRASRALSPKQLSRRLLAQAEIASDNNATNVTFDSPGPYEVAQARLAVEATVPGGGGGSDVHDLIGAMALVFILGVLVRWALGPMLRRMVAATQRQGLTLVSFSA